MSVIELIRTLAYEATRKDDPQSVKQAMQNIYYLATKEIEYERMRLKNYKEMLKINTI